jgi:hypothetical protein
MTRSHDRFICSACNLDVNLDRDKLAEFERSEGRKCWTNPFCQHPSFSVCINFHITRFIELSAGCVNLRKLGLSSFSQLIASIVWIMAMYTIIHVDKSWIVCTVQGKLFIFDRKSLALKTVHDAKELLHGDETSKRQPTTVCSEGGRDYWMI